MIPVILSGGSGSRLWPLSRKQFPKQFLALTGEHTLFQQTLERLVFEGMDTPIVVCNKDHRFIVNEQLAARKLETQRILMEPFGRNTAPAVAIAAMHLLAAGRDELLLVLPADHVIEDLPVFHSALGVARKAAEQGEMVLFGIPAERPETGYGYIEQGEPVGAGFAVSRLPGFGTVDLHARYALNKDWSLALRLNHRKFPAALVAHIPLWHSDALRWQLHDPSLRLNPGHAPPAPHAI